MARLTQTQWIMGIAAILLLGGLRGTFTPKVNSGCAACNSKPEPVLELLP